MGGEIPDPNKKALVDALRLQVEPGGRTFAEQAGPLEHAFNDEIRNLLSAVERDDKGVVRTCVGRFGQRIDELIGKYLE